MMRCDAKQKLNTHATRAEELVDEVEPVVELLLLVRVGELVEAFVEDVAVEDGVEICDEEVLEDASEVLVTGELVGTTVDEG